jgi:hypothetical protein
MSKRLRQFVRDVALRSRRVFTYSHEEGHAGFRSTDDVPAAEEAAAAPELMSLQKRIVTTRTAQARGEQVRLLVDGPSSDHDLVWRARTEGQAPDIDPRRVPHGRRPVEPVAGPVHHRGTGRESRVRPRGTPLVASSLRDTLEGRHLSGVGLQVGSCPLFLFGDLRTAVRARGSDRADGR